MVCNIFRTLQSHRSVSYNCQLAIMYNRHGATVVGTCKRMCSESEIKKRERNRQIHKYEADDKCSSNLFRKADPDKCVKEFTRAAAGQVTPKAADLRPPSVLMTTVDYLLTKILTLPNERWIERYDFIYDRLRSVRQDMIFQDVFNVTCARAMESIVRFHIYSIYKSVKLSIEEYDSYINETHLRECLKRLLVFYNDTSCCTHSRSEMETYYMLFYLGSNEVLQHLSTIPLAVRSNALCQKAAIITQSWLLGNFVRAFRVIKTLPFLCCLTLLPHIENIRRHSLRVMNTGYSVKNSKYPLRKLVDILLFDDVKEAAATCKYYGINVDADYAYFIRTSFLGEQPVLKMKRYKFINEKYDQSVLPSLLLGDV